MNGKYYLLVLCNQFSGFAEVAALAKKGEAPWVVQAIILRWSALLLGRPFGCLRSDRAKEFLVGWFEDWLVEMEATHELSLPYTPQQNGTAERYNGVVGDIARTLLIESKLPKSFWPYAFYCACYLRNRLPTSGGATPHELFFGHRPCVSLLRVFGSLCYVTLVNGKKRSKLGERSVEGRFVGYSRLSKGYLIWVPLYHQIVESRDVRFFEEFDHSSVPGHTPYDGTSLVAAPPPVTSDVSILAEVSLPIPRPLGAVVKTGMVLRPRPAALRDIPGVSKKGGVKGVPQISSKRNFLPVDPPSPSSRALVGDGGAISCIPVLVDNPLFSATGSPQLAQPQVTPLIGSLGSFSPRSVLDNPLFEQGELVTLHGPNSLSVGHASGDPASRDNSRGGTTRSESVSSLESVATGHDVPGWGQPTGLGLTGSSLVQTSLGSRSALLTPGEGLSQVPSPNSDGELAPEPVTPVTRSISPSTGITKLEGKDDDLVLGLSAALASDEEAAPYAAFISSTTDLTYETATAADNPDRDAWIIACKDEMASIAAHGTWILTPASRVKRKILPNMWIFTIKNGLDGQPERHKARVVIKGFHQRPGLEFDAVYAPVTSKATFRILLATAVHRKMFCRQLDIKTAFLNGLLDEDLELYCHQPAGFVELDSDRVPFVCRLVKSLYGLKQAPRMWCREVRKVLVKEGYRSSRADPALFVKQELDGSWSYVLTYVDDFWICIDDLVLYDRLLAAMRRAGWEVKELTCAQFLSLDMQLTLDAEGRTTQIILSQHNAITALVERFNQCKAHEGNATIPMLAGAWTGDAVNSALLPNNKLYISLVGSLIYLSTCPRPDIAYAVSCLSRFSAVPTRAHWKAAKRLLLYLKLHKDWGLCYSHTPVFDLTVFSDASFGEDKVTRRSQTGISILVGGTLVHWISKRQITPAVSTAESEYQALSNAAREVQWIKQLRNDLGLPCTLVTIQCDRQGALSWTGDWKLEPKAKHIDIIHHYIKCLVEDKRLAVTYVNTKDNKADPFTKPLTPALFWEFMKLHGMVSLAKAQATASS
eukprot:gene16835-biopygen25752